MTFEKPERAPRKVHLIWSPSRSKRTSIKVERVPLPLSEEIRFEFYRPATSAKGGCYAEA